MSSISAKSLLNGTFGKFAYDGEEVAECKALSAKITFDKESVDIPGQLMAGSRVTGAKGTGSVTLYRISSQFSTGYVADVIDGVDPRGTIISTVENETTGDMERIQLDDVSFDEATLADWKQKTLQEITIPFTFSDYDVLDEISY